MSRDRIEARSIAGEARDRFLFVDPFCLSFGGQLVFENGLACFPFA
jgi:hypothetical protein